jgi:oligopeptide transport system substrate-binding protein
MPVKPATVLNDRYTLQAEIGRGGWATVYRAHDSLLDRVVAVKLIHKSDLSPHDRQRLLHEARLAARLNHPNIVAVHDAGEIDGTPFIVMEYVEGTSLHARPPASLPEAIDGAQQLCRALAHAHAQGIVHRDLKPENILRTASGVLKLTDFGLALSPASRVSSDGLIVGTVFYLAPEQIRGGPLDGRADLYALGVLLYEWSTGVLPFTADEALAVLTQHLFSPVVVPRARVPDLPAALDHLIVSLLSKSPEDRPASAEDVLALLESPRLIEPETTAAEVPILERLQRGRMAGREVELQQARRLWSQVQAGATRTLLISGEAGIGKSRLVRELVAQAGMGKALVLEGWNVDQPEPPFTVFRQMLRGAFSELAEPLAQCPEPVLADLLRLIPEAQPSFPEVIVEPSSGTAEVQQRLFESMAVLLALVSQRAPVLLIVEDAQWADSGSLNLLRYLIQQIRERPVLFLMTYRPVEPAEAPSLHQALHDFQRGQVAATVRLERLDRAGTEEMVGIMFGAEAMSDFADRVFRITEGNPFFIEEVCKGLAETGRLNQRDGRWQLLETGRLEIPANVRVAIRGRLRAMPSETQQALEVAAVRGAAFEAELVRQVRHLDQAAVSDALEAAERAEIVRQVGDGDRPRFVFTHSLIPMAMVEDMRPAARRALHAQVAQVLAVLEPEEVETLAHHYRAAGDSDRAVHFLLLAGERAQSVCACPEAIEYYTAAAALQRQAGSSEALARTLLKLGLACSADFQFDQARRAYEEAFDLWERFLDSGAPPSGPPVTLRYALSEPITLDPGQAGADTSTFVIGQLMEGLLEIDEAWGIVPGLAARWEVSDDGRRYIFRLRRGWTWGDGHPLTAGDFEYAWKRNLALGSSSAPSRLLYVIQNAQPFAEGRSAAPEVGVRAVNDHTLEVRLERPASFFPQLLTHPVTYPLPRWIVEGEGQPWTDRARFVGNGAFRLEAWEPGKSMVFQRNPQYRGLSRGNVTRVEAPIIGDFDSLLEAFDAETLDGISLLQADPATIRRLRTAYRRRFATTPALTTVFLSFDCSRPPFDNPAVRQAFAQAIDRPALLEIAGAHRPAPGGFLPPGMPGHTASIGLGFDPADGRRKLAGAGFAEAEGFPEIELLHVGARETANPVAAYLVRGWEESLGVLVRPLGVDWAEFLRRRDHQPAAISISGWSADYPDPDNMLRVQFHGREGLNAIGWNNPEFDQVTERAASISDRKQRIELYQRADRLLVEEAAAIVPLWYSQGRRLVQPYVRVPPVPSSEMRFKHVVVDRGGE